MLMTPNQRWLVGITHDRGSVKGRTEPRRPNEESIAEAAATMDETTVIEGCCSDGPSSRRTPDER